VLNGCLLATQGSGASQPEHAGPEMRLRIGILKEQSLLTGKLIHVERVCHQQEHIHVIRPRLGRDKRPEHHQTR